MQPSRMNAMAIPREHGAWGMMLVPLSMGAAVALRSGRLNGGALILFLVASMSVFWLRTPLEAWLGTSAIKAQTEPERALVCRIVVVAAGLAVTSMGALLAGGHARGLLFIGAVGFFAFGVQAVIKKTGRKGRMPSQIVGAIGLTSTAAGAYYVATGQLNQTTFALWLASWLFAANQIHFVQLRIHGNRAETFSQRMRHGLMFFAGQVLLVVTVCVAYRFAIFPATIALAFVPVLVRGTLWFVRHRQPLDVHKLGLAELTQSLVFGALASAAFLL